MAFDLAKLKELATRVGGILVMNGNEPELVILPYEKFASETLPTSVQPSLPVPPTPVTAPIHQSTPIPTISTPVAPTPVMPQPSAPSMDDQILIDALNKEIFALKEEIRQRETNVELGEPREA